MTLMMLIVADNDVVQLSVIVAVCVAPIAIKRRRRVAAK